MFCYKPVKVKTKRIFLWFYKKELKPCGSCFACRSYINTAKNQILLDNIKREDISYSEYVKKYVK